MCLWSSDLLSLPLSFLSFSFSLLSLSLSVVFVYIYVFFFLYIYMYIFARASILIFIYPSSLSICGKIWWGLCKYAKLQRGRNSLRLCERSCWDRYMFTRSRRRSWVCPNARCVLSRGSEYLLFLSFLSFDLHLHPSSFYFDMNFGKAPSA